MRLWVRSLASLSGLRIWRFRELWCSPQIQLGSGIVAAVAQPGSYSSNWTPSPGTTTCRRGGPRNSKKKKTKKTKKTKQRTVLKKKKKKANVPLILISVLPFYSFEFQVQCYHQPEIFQDFDSQSNAIIFA